MASKDGSDPYIEFIHRLIDEAAVMIVRHFPTVKDATMEALEAVFQTRAVTRQLALAIALETGLVSVKQVLTVVKYILSNFSSRARLIRQLEKEQRQTETLDEWMDLAEKIDNVQGNDVWRSEPDCRLYERDRISARVDEFVHLMRRRDIFELMFVLRGGIARNKFGLLHEGLFSKAMAGTKVLVETYHNVVCAALDYVCDSPVPQGEQPIPTDARLAFFNETRHAYGRTAILLSGGAALGMYHLGVVKTLINNRLMPRVIGGSSAGSIVCAMIGTRTDEECCRDLFEMNGTVAPGHSGDVVYKFFRPLNRGNPIPDSSSAEGSSIKDSKTVWQLLVPIPLRRFSSFVFDLLTLKTRPNEILMSDTEFLREGVRTNVGDFTFQEAFDRTGRILNITVTPNNSSDPPRLLNYLTAPHVLVWSAAVASSSLPGVFESNRLMVKDADGTIRYESAEKAAFADGSLEQDLPMQQLSEMFNVNHFIVSQANPHAVMFASNIHFRSIWSNPIKGILNAVLSFLKDQCRSWLAQVVQLVGSRMLAPQQAANRAVATQILLQEYEGRPCDISLVPWVNHRSLISAFLHVLYNPSKDELLEWILAAERETWRVIPAIKSHIAEEVTLDRCVQRLRTRLAAESFEKRKAVVSDSKKMGERVPSFFASPSLVNLGGMGVTDQSQLESNADLWGDHAAFNENGDLLKESLDPPPIPIQPGWRGMGLSGNKSTGSLEKSSSVASGLFIESNDSNGQSTAEHTIPSSIQHSEVKTTSSAEEFGSKGYVNTTNMTNFYYRNSSSHGNLKKSFSGHTQIGGARMTTLNRRISQSYSDMAKFTQ
eukprot:Nitzschia sp. Nitz4//scaffold10_size219509//111906//114647//NITZ4_001432-RA/size219509-processed-gene-0.336-mRNA-1//-1//CDS//3329532932//5630//frame0